jgi:hypothetical protein
MTSGAGWRRVRLIVLSTLLLGLTAYTGCDLWAARRVAAELARLESRSGSFDNGPIAAPKVPAPENRALLINAATALVDPGTLQEIQAVSTFVMDPAPKTVPPALRTYVESNAEAIRLSREFVTRPRSSFGVDYRSSVDRPPVANTMMLTYILYMASLRAMEARQLDDATALIVAGLSMSSARRDEPDLIAQLIRIAAADPPVDALQRLIETSELSKGALEQLARALAENREPAPMTIGLIGEVKHVHYVFTQFEAGRSPDVGASSLPWPLLSPATRLMRPFLRWTHAGYLEQANTALEFQMGPRPRGPRIDTRPPWAFIDRLSYTFAGFTAETANLITAGNATELGDDFTSQLAAAELVVALRRFKLDRGVYPDNLLAVTPAYLTAVPIDPFTGLPPVYARDRQGFTLKIRRSENYATRKQTTPTWKVVSS